MKRALFPVVFLAFAAGCGGPSAADTPTATTTATDPASFAVYGSLEMPIHETVYDSMGRTCAGDGGYDDIRAGAQVVVTDADGGTVALGELSQGRMDGSVPDATCQWRFTVADVPAGAGFYGVEVTHRGALQYTEQELRSPISLSLG